MARRPPPSSGPARMETVAGYYRQGRQLLKAAIAAFPALDPPAALIELQKAGGPLDPSSVLVYRASLRRIASVLLRLEGREGDFDLYWAMLDGALTARKAKIDKKHKQTSAKKVKDATEAEVAALFAEFKRHALQWGNPNAVLAGLFTLVAGHSGFRPIELLGAELNVAILTLPNAKRRAGQAERRVQNLDFLHEDVRIGLGLLLSLIDHDMSRRAFRAWEKCLAEQIRRACRRIGIRPLALYSFRHIAIATWSKAGLSPAEIARLCGHISIRTAHSHYARAAAGHKRKAIVRAAASPNLQSGPADLSVPGTADGAATPIALDTGRAAGTDHILDYDDMPQPKPLPRTEPEPMSPEAMAAAFARYDQDLDPARIGERIRKARQQRFETEEKVLLHPGVQEETD